MTNDNLLTKLQHEFSAQASTTSALIDAMKVINTAVLNKEYCLAIFMDTSKAFDCIDYILLLNKLEAYGIRGIALDWFSSYLYTLMIYL